MLDLLPSLQRTSHVRVASEAEVVIRDNGELQYRSNRGPGAPLKSPSTARPPPTRPFQTSEVAPPQPQLRNLPFKSKFNGDISDHFQSLNLGSDSNAERYGRSIPNVLTPGNRRDYHAGHAYVPSALDSFVVLRNPVPRPPVLVPWPSNDSGEMLAPRRFEEQLSRSAPPEVNPVDPVSLPPPSTSTPPVQSISAASEPPATTISLSNGSYQCSGVTKANRRCRNPVRPLPTALLMADDDQGVIVYCHAHSKEILKVSGFFSKVEFVRFDDFIPEYLQEDTKVAIRTEMTKPISDADKEGCIYCYQTEDQEQPDLVHLKVGRAVDPVKRFGEWATQCRKESEPILRGWYPPDSPGKDCNVRLLRGNTRVKTKGKHCHRTERLIHLELLDLMLYKPYKKDGFFAPAATEAEERDSEDGASGDLPDTGSSSVPASAKGSNKRSTKLKPVRNPCAGCGKVHKEIFAFDPLDGDLTGKEWEKIVMPVIMKWGGFVNNQM